MRTTVFASMFAIAALAACKGHSNEPPAADNTAQNDRDHRTAPTAQNTSNKSSDVDVTQQIRKAVMDDSSLSTNAHNCKIVVQDGAVTLVGPVASDAERVRVAEIATQASGGRSVVNQLEVVR